MKCKLIDCKNKITKNIINIDYCHVHYKNFIKTYIIKIQKIYRGYKIRKKIFFYKKLPTDIQYIIQFYINKEFKLERQNKIISNIIINKIDKFIINYYNLNSHINYLNNYIENYVYLLMNNNEYIINRLLHLFYLLDKYKIIIMLNKQFYVSKYRYNILRVNMYEKLVDLNNLLLNNINKLTPYQIYKYKNNLNNFKSF
tara:strand:- start:792 stop:1388 length:597 start_codon:yes stop_codon:yes gene_type:complete